MSTVRTLIAMSTQRGGAAACDGQQQFFVLSVDPLATALNERLPGTANDIGHLQRRPIHALCVGSPSPWRGSASSGLPVALRCRRPRDEIGNVQLFIIVNILGCPPRSRKSGVQSQDVPGQTVKHVLELDTKSARPGTLGTDEKHS
jgi:hypothetical protein